MRILAAILLLTFASAFGSTPTTAIPPRVNGNVVSQVLEATWYGALGNGVDDTIALQDAINAANTKKLPLHIPSTTVYYAISSELTGFDNLVIYGDGPASVIRQTSTGNNGKNVMRIDGKTNVTIRGVHFDASGAFTTSTPDFGASFCGLVLRDCKDCVVEGCTFTGSAAFSILNYVSDRTVIRNNYFYNPAHVDPYAFQSQTTAIVSADSSDVKVTGNKIWKANAIGWVNGIDIHSHITNSFVISRRNIVNGNWVSDCSQYGVLCYAGVDKTLFGTQVINNSFYRIDGSYHHIVAGTAYTNITFGTASGTCVYMQNSLESAVDGNIMWDSGRFTRSAGTLARSAISGSSTPDISIRNNEIWRHGYMGMNINNGGSFGDYTNKDVSVINNTIVNCGFYANTGSVQAGSNQLTLDDATPPIETDTTRAAVGGFWVGDKIQIKGAGTAGAILESEITGISGSVITLIGNAITSVTNSGVCLSELSTTPPSSRYGMDFILVDRPQVHDNKITKDLTNSWILTRGVFMQGTSSLVPMIDPSFSGNSMFGTYEGINIARAVGANISDNTLDNIFTTAIVANQLMSDVDIHHNRITQASTGISVASSGSVTRNTIKSAVIGITDTGAELADNTMTSVTTQYSADTPSFNARTAVGYRSSRAGLAIDGNASARITGTAGVNIGLNDFTISFWPKLLDYTPSVETTVFATHTTGNNRIQVAIETDGTIRTKVTDNAAATVNYDITPSTALVDNQLYSMMITYTRSGNAVLYLNGDVKGSVSFSGASAIDIGNGNANVWNAGASYLGILNGLTVYNRALSATEAQQFWGAGGIDYADQWATSTPTYTSDFSAGVDSFAGVAATVAGNVDGIGGQDDNLRLTVDSSLNASHYTARSGSLFTAGKAYKISLSVYIPSANATLKTIVLSDGAGLFVPSSATADSWFTFTTTLVMKDSSFRIFAGNSAGSVVFDGNGTDVFYVRAITATEYGGMLNLDLEETDPAISSVIPDRSSFSNNGSGSAGLQQIKTIKLPIAYGTSILKGNGSGAVTSASIGTDFYKPGSPNVSMWEDEFLDGGQATLSGSRWTVVVNGGQWAQIGLIANHYGSKQLSTLASASSAPIILLYGAGFGFGTDAIENGFYIATPSALSDGTDTYMIFVGFGDTSTSALATDAAYIVYKHDVNSGKWTGVTSNNSVTNTMTGGSGGTTMAINTWYFLQVKCNAAGTLVSFYVDGVLIGTSAAQIPTGTARAFGPMCQIVKLAGTTARTVLVDYYYHKITFTTPRFTLSP